MEKILLSLEDLSKVNGGIFYDFIGKYRASGTLLSNGANSILVESALYENFKAIATNFGVQEDDMELFIFDFFMQSAQDPNSNVRIQGQYADLNAYKAAQNPRSFKYVDGTTRNFPGI